MKNSSYHFDFPLVKSLKNLEIGRVYATKKYNLFSRLDANRGAKNSIKTSKLKEFRELYEAGHFYAQASYVLINLKGWIIEGHHRTAMLEAIGVPVAFIVTAQPEFNMGTKSEVLNHVSRFNSVNGKWTGIDAFNSALSCEEPLAVAFDEIRAELKAKYDNRMLTPGRLYALLTENEKDLHGNNKDRSVFCNEGLAEKALKQDFALKLKYIMRVCQLVNDFNADPDVIKKMDAWKVIKAIMPMFWSNEANMDKMFHLMSVDKFKNISKVTMPVIRAYLTELSHKRVNKNVNLIAWNY
jgi:hypothetical protein